MSLTSTNHPPPAKSKAAVTNNDMANTSGKTVHPGASLANGPVERMDIDKPTTNGNGNKRKSSLGNRKSYKDASDSDSDDVPISKKRKTSKAMADDSDDEPLAKVTKQPIKATAAQIGGKGAGQPMAKTLEKAKEAIEKNAEKEAKAIRSADAKRKKASSDDEDDVPLAKKKNPATKAQANGTKKAKKVKDESDSDDAPLAKKAAAKKAPAAKKAAVKKQASTPAKKGKVKKEESAEEEDGEEEEEPYRWWEDMGNGDDTTKWTTLEHNGVIFPPEYTPLPKNVKMLYDGKPVSMHKDAEEIAYAFGAMLMSTHNTENPTFQKNFLHDFKEMLDKTGGAKDESGNTVKITKFEKCDFTPIFNHVDAERTAKKALSGAEKKALKAEKDAIEAPYQYCLWDGRKQKVGNFRVEPPGLFRGRGEHPKTGKWKKRVLPEQVTINIGKDAMVPKPPEGHKWKEVKHDGEGTWLAMWQENINNAYKYVMLAANSDIKGMSDFKKFEKARELKKHIDKIRKDYEKELKSEVMAERQRATAVYLIDRFALRAGNEKSDDEADTVGCCSLKFENISLSPPNKVIFDFLGKDSIRFYNEVEVDPQVFKNLKIFKRSPKKEGDEIFDRLTTSSLNKHLSNYMPGLTAKVFRTYNASYTMATLLRELKAEGNIMDKVKAYNDANRMVAILCNHKRTVAAGHEGQMEKMEDKINGLRYQQYRIKHMMIDLDPKMKKKKGEAYFALPEGLDKDWQVKHHEALVEELRTKVQKKFDKENEKLEADGEKPLKAKELEQRMVVVKELESKLKQELKKGKVEAEGKSATVDKYEKDLEKLDARIATMRLQAEDRDNNKEVALGTSKINYIDPRLTVVFSKKFDVPIERFFSKTLRDKFNWALQSADEDWDF
ncbi:DNA topoisomerase I like protein [Zymoseptoria brevis]|uniref:DNA topoisomerase I n=1 Tax=Zymoseptoria brevis TaxID=1047168 RepID=A0A0F4G6F4_9PEZI|nr:DNA topoisomerase I like protein [Zymoseptoria brevis]